MRPNIIPGARFPDYELIDHTRTRPKLSELHGCSCPFAACTRYVEDQLGEVVLVPSSAMA
jgi:hypothetical protein